MQIFSATHHEMNIFISRIKRMERFIFQNFERVKRTVVQAHRPPLGFLPNGMKGNFHDILVFPFTCFPVKSFPFYFSLSRVFG